MATIGTAAVLGDVNWLMVGSAAILSGLLSLLTSIAGLQSALRFYGSSFLTDETGAILAQAGRNEDEVLCAGYDFAAIREARLSWGLFRGKLIQK